MGSRPGMGSPWQQQPQECGPPCLLQLQGAAGGRVQTLAPQDLGREVGHRPQHPRQARPKAALSAGSKTPSVRGRPR